MGLTPDQNSKRFTVDVRGLDMAQTQFVYNQLIASPDDFTVADIRSGFITIELSVGQLVARVLLDGTHVQRSLADMIDLECEQRKDLFGSSSLFAWQTRVRPQ
jgi:hypothetical protein